MQKFLVSVRLAWRWFLGAQTSGQKGTGRVFKGEGRWGESIPRRILMGKWMGVPGSDYYGTTDITQTW